jgi:signal transduction histidine kinase
MTVDPPIEFPELPRSELERAIEELVEKARLVLATQGRLRSLLRATRAIGEDLDLSVVLRRIVASAVDLVGARYGALGVVGPNGDLEEFIHVGLEREESDRIGHLPQGRGILGALISDQRPIRLEHISADPRSVGFPEHHPRMDSFLGVPIRVRGEVFGNLFLTDRVRGGPFSAEDEELLTALAASAGIAIDNARLFGETQRRQRWAIASAEVSAALLDEEGADPLGLVAEAVAALTEAALVLLVRPAAGNALVVEYAWGEDADVYAGRAFPAEGSVSGSVIASGNPVLSPGLPLPYIGERELFTGPAMVVPLAGGNGPYGSLTVVRAIGRPHFLDSDLDMAADFAAHASVALELREVRGSRERVALLEDRSRIARDLHDNVIQRLFAAGLSLHSVDLDGVPPPVRSKVHAVNDLLDQAITEIRKSVFALAATEQPGTSARHRLLDAVAEAAGAFPVPPRIVFEGQLDEWAPPDLVDDLEAVVREGVSNAARHAMASGVVVTVVADEREIRVSVTDDGKGPGDPTRASGTANLQARASGWGGRSVLQPGETGGAVLDWRVPTPTRQGAA